MVETVHIMQNKDAAITWCHGVDHLLDCQTVDDPCLRQIAFTQSASGVPIGECCQQLVERNSIQRSFAQVHENDVHGHPMQPRTEHGVAAEAGEFTVNLEECLLG